jgi:hypothetical protein
MNTLLLCNEYPPHVCGGAGVHVAYLSQELAKLNRGNTIFRFFASETKKKQLKILRSRE